MTHLGTLLLAICLLVTCASAQSSETMFPAREHDASVLTIHAATDLDAMAPLIKDFQAAAPDVTIRYREYVTNELYQRTQAECSEKRVGADLLITSSVDHLVVLSNEGCAQQHRSTETAATPAWTKWRNEVFGFTLEPAVIVYNRALMSPLEVPRTRLDLIELLRREPVRFEGKIGAYDIAQSGIGYLFASLDARNELVYGRLLEGFGRAKVVTRCCSSELLAELADGRLLLGYNLLGSYAYAAQRRGAPIGIVLPDDYVLGLSRGLMLPIHAVNTPAARRFVDYLLSARGQGVVREHAFFFDFAGVKPPKVEGPASLVEAGTLRQVVIGPGLLPMQDKAKREKFLSGWFQSIRPIHGGGVLTEPNAK
jgi:iron(III) transport system substrate-binding protein